jgi:hypothetical protein
MKSVTRLFGVVAVVAVFAFVASGCALFKPTPSGDCPQVTTTGASLIAYGGALAALDSGAPVSVLVKVASNIDAVVISGKFDADIINIALANSGGAKWAQYLGGAALLFKTEFNGIVNSNVNTQVCTVPVLQNISIGIKQAIAVGGQPMAAKLAVYRK